MLLAHANRTRFVDDELRPLATISATDRSAVAEAGARLLEFLAPHAATRQVEFGAPA